MHYYVWILYLIPIINLAYSTFEIRGPDFVNHIRQVPLACSCEDPSLCNPIPPAKGNNRIGYSKFPKNWKYYDLTKITELILFFDIAEIDPEMVCMAHKNNVQLHLRGHFDNDTFLDPLKQEKWIQDHLKMLTDNHLDGINIDYEKPRYAETEPYLIAFMVELSKRVRSLNSNYLLTFCLQTGPVPIYDMVTIPTVMDYLMIMDYDQEWGNDCYATANEQPMRTIDGLTRYLKLGIPPDKIVIGMPWYGYLFTCENITSSGRCSIKNCSHDYAVQSTIPSVYTKYEVDGDYNLKQSWDNETLSPFLTITPKEDDILSDPLQFWYDNSVSLTRKAEIYKPFQIRGIAAFHVDCLNYTNPSMQSMNKAFWNFFTMFQD